MGRFQIGFRIVLGRVGSAWVWFGMLCGCFEDALALFWGCFCGVLGRFWRGCAKIFANPDFNNLLDAGWNQNPAPT